MNNAVKLPPGYDEYDPFEDPPEAAKQALEGANDKDFKIGHAPIKKAGGKKGGKHPNLIELNREQNETRLNFAFPSDQTEKLYLDATTRRAKQQANASMKKGADWEDFSFRPELTAHSRQLMGKSADQLSRSQQWEVNRNAKLAEHREAQKEQQEKEMAAATEKYVWLNKGSNTSKVRQVIEAMDDLANTKKLRVAAKDPNYIAEGQAEAERKKRMDLLRQQNLRKNQVYSLLRSVTPEKVQIPVGRNFDPEHEKPKLYKATGGKGL